MRLSARQNRNRMIGVTVTDEERALFTVAAEYEVSHVPGATLGVGPWLRNQGMRRVLEIVRSNFLALLRWRWRRDYFLHHSRSHQRRMERRRLRARLLGILVAYKMRERFRGL